MTKILQSDESCYHLWVFHVIRGYCKSVISIGSNNGKIECCTGRLSEIFVLGINLPLYHGMMQCMRFPSKTTGRANECTLSPPLAKFTPLGIGIKKLSKAGQLSVFRGPVFLVTRFKFTTALSVKALNVAYEKTSTRLSASNINTAEEPFTKGWCHTAAHEAHAQETHPCFTATEHEKKFELRTPGIILEGHLDRSFHFLNSSQLLRAKEESTCATQINFQTEVMWDI